MSKTNQRILIYFLETILIFVIFGLFVIEGKGIISNSVMTVSVVSLVVVCLGMDVYRRITRWQR